MLARTVLEDVATELGRAGVDTLAVKGIVTATWLYADPSERPLGDVDVRIRPADFGEAYRVCQRAGWDVSRRVWTYRNLTLTVKGFPVDVESYVGPPGLAALAVTEMFDRATRDPGGFWVPEPHDHAVLLTVNVFKDKLTRAFPWSLDDAERVVRAKGIDVGMFVERLRQARVMALGWVVADWMVRERKSEGWGEVLARIERTGRPRPRFTRVVRDLVARDDPFSLPLRLLARMASDDPTRWPGAILRSAAWEIEQRWDGRWRAPR
jgi:hypothetical protein